MRSKGAKIPEQWESLEDADISELTNTFAYNLSNEKNFIINYLIECLVDNQPFDCSSLGPNKYLNE
mgnify:CR=1 FL=1